MVAVTKASLGVRARRLKPKEQDPKKIIEKVLAGLQFEGSGENLKGIFSTDNPNLGLNFFSDSSDADRSIASTDTNLFQRISKAIQNSISLHEPRIKQTPFTRRRTHE